MRLEQIIKFLVRLIKFSFFWIYERAWRAEDFLLGLDNLAEALVVSKRFLFAGIETFTDLADVFYSELTGFV